MPASRRLFTVFLASPSDVEEERNVAESVVDVVNKSVANQIGWQIDIRRWEDTLPSFRRPQDVINPLVNECDLFVGLLWERWGQPTASYSSGFEEEFELAKARRKTDGTPEIWLMFKDIDPTKMKDPGEHLKKVMEFRELQIRLNEVKFAKVQDTEDWRSKLQMWLTRYLLQFNFEHPEVSPQQAIAAPAPTSAATITIEEVSSLGLPSDRPHQLRATSAALSTAAADNTLDLFARDGGLSEFQVARLFLLSGTLISRRYTNLVLGAHEINLLYKHREKLDAATDERIEILRSIIGAERDLNPGWFWFQSLDEQHIFDLLFKLAIDDISDDVRIGALDLLALSRFEIPRASWLFLPLTHESWSIRESAFNYLSELGDESTIEFLDGVAASADDSFFAANARDARFRIVTRLNPDLALAEVIAQDQFLSSDKLRLLEENSSKASEEILLRGAESTSEQMKKICLTELAQRSRLPTAVAHKMVQDSSLVVRAIALLSLAEKGELPGPQLVRNALKNPQAESGRLYGGALDALSGNKKEAVPDADSIIVTFYSTQSIETTLGAVDWYDLDGVLAYKALALNHFDTVSSTIRDDLKNGFRRIREDTLRRSLETDGADAAERFRSTFEKYDSFIESLFAEAALLGIARNGLPDAAEIAKPYLLRDQFRLREAAVKVLCKFGNSNELLQIAKDVYGEQQKEAASAALKTSSTPLVTAADLLGSGDDNLAKVAFSWMLNENSDDLTDVFSKFLHDEDSERRLRSLSWLSRRLPRNDLETALLTYIANGSYYYDVVAYLDRLLYAPPRLRASFARKLEQKWS